MKYNWNRGGNGSKTFAVNGGKHNGHHIKWIEKPPQPIVACACGRLYIKTRRGQRGCLWCMLGRPA